MAYIKIFSENHCCVVILKRNKEIRKQLTQTHTHTECNTNKKNTHLEQRLMNTISAFRNNCHILNSIPVEDSLRLFLGELDPKIY